MPYLLITVNAHGSRFGVPLFKTRNHHLKRFPSVSVKYAKMRNQVA